MYCYTHLPLLVALAVPAASDRRHCTVYNIARRQDTVTTTSRSLVKPQLEFRLSLWQPRRRSLHWRTATQLELQSGIVPGSFTAKAKGITNSSYAGPVSASICRRLQGASAQKQQQKSNHTTPAGIPVPRERAGQRGARGQQGR